jgi:hypothetical protein
MRGRFRKIRNGSWKAISLFDAKNSLFTAEQGILCNPLISQREKAPPPSKQV